MDSFYINRKNKQYYQANREKILEQKKEYYQENKHMISIRRKRLYKIKKLQEKLKNI